MAWPKGPSSKESVGKGRKGERAVGLTLGPCHTGPPAQGQHREQPCGQRHVQVSWMSRAGRGFWLGSGARPISPALVAFHPLLFLLQCLRGEIWKRVRSPTFLSIPMGIASGEGVKALMPERQEACAPFPAVSSAGTLG